MRILTVVHQSDAGPGVFAEVAREQGHELVEWMPPEMGPPSDLAEYDAALVLGGAMNVDDDDRCSWLDPEKEALRDLFEGGTPMLGVCLGAQLLAEAAGGKARRAQHPEIGWFDIEVADAAADDPLLGPLAPGFEAFEWHSYEFVPPRRTTVLASSDVGVQAGRLGPASWGIQFHAEVDSATARHWIDDYETDPDAVRIGIDPGRMWEETEPKLPAWNELGRELFSRWLGAIPA